MTPRKLRVHTLASGFRMRSRDNLIRLRDNKLRPIGIGDYRSLLAAPVLLALIILVGWLRMPATTRQTYRPADEPYARPMVGWALPAQTWGEESPIDVSLVYAEVTWAELEPEEGQFAFEAFEEKNHLNEWWAAGKRLILRFVADRPGEPGHKDVPEWLIEAIGSEELAGRYYETSAGGGYSPDYSNLMMREAHRKAIAALAGRYDDHPGVAYIELGSLGWDGEWTVDLTDAEVEKLPISTISREYAWHYTSAFSETLMLMRRPYKETELLSVGLYNPQLGDAEATWAYLDSIESGGYDRQIETDLIAMPDFYSHSPSGAHIPAEADMEALLAGQSVSLSRQIAESHLDYVVLEGELSGLSDEAAAALREIEMLIGCRMWVRSAQWDSRMKTGVRSKALLCIRNDGASPLDARWPIALALFDGEEMICCETTELDTSMLQPGDNDLTAWIDVPYDADVGVYELKLAILDPATGQPGMRMSMAECDPDTLWTVLGELRVIG